MKPSTASPTQTRTQSRLRFCFNFIFKVYKEGTPSLAPKPLKGHILTCKVTLHTILFSGLNIKILPMASPGYKMDNS